MAPTKSVLESLFITCLFVNSTGVAVLKIKQGGTKSTIIDIQIFNWAKKNVATTALDGPLHQGLTPTNYYRNQDSKAFVVNICNLSSCVVIYYIVMKE